MTAVLFAGGRLDSVTTSGTVTESTTGGRFDATYCDAALAVGAGQTNYFMASMRDSAGAVTTLSGTQSGMFHCEAYLVNPGTSVGYILALFDSSGFPWLALRSAGSANTYGLYYNSNTGASPTWTLLGSTFTITTNTLHKFDISLTLGSPHSATFYLNNSATTGTGTFTQASFSNVGVMRGYGDPSSSNTYYYSQLLAAEGRSTVNGKVKYSRATGAGGNSGWAGAYTNVNEAVNSDATVDTSATAGQRQTYAMGDVTVPSGFAIISVFHWLRAKNDGAAPANIKSSLRISSTNYDAASDLAGIGSGFAGLLERYDTDPSTAAAWTQSGWNASEAGYLSAT